MPLFSTSRARTRTQNNVSAEAPLSKFACATANQSDQFPDPGNQPKSAWEHYLEIMDIIDDDREREWQDLLDVILVFAALFASFLSTFLIQTLSLLQPGPLDAIQEILLYQTLVIQNSTSGPYVPSAFSPPPYAIAVNALFFASLGVVLLAAFLCMLVKGWIRELDSNLRSIPDLQKRAVIKQLRWHGLHRWRFQEVVTILPALIHISLALFFIGLSLYLFQVHKLPAFITIYIFGIGVLLYVFSIFISAIDDFSPFRSRYFPLLGVLYRRLYSGLLSTLVYHRSSFMALPHTIAEKIRERMSTFIKAHEPLTEQDIRYPQSPSAKQLTSKASASVLNFLWYYRYDTSAYAKDVCASVLLQLDDLDICPPHDWHLHWLYETSRPSMKEAQCLVYAACMQGSLPVSSRLKTIRASVEVLEQYPDPWFRLVTLLIRSRVDSDDWNMLQGRDAALWEAELLQAISDIERFSEEQWLFVLSAILAKLNNSNTQSTRALAQILVRLLQSRSPLSPIRGEGIDFWLHAMMTLLGGRSFASKSITNPDGEIEHMQDIEGYGKGNLRNPDYIRQLLRLSQKHGLDPSLIRGCLVMVLCILIVRGPFDEHGPINQQEIRLINQYLDIIREEMDVITWSIPLTEQPILSFPTRYLQWVVSCLLSGRFILQTHHWAPSKILCGFDHKITTAGAQPTTSILEVIDQVYQDVPPVTGAKLQNAWLSLYDHNRTRSTFISTIPLTWSPDCTSIASKRLDLYDSGTVAPEMNLVISFLSSHSVSIACRALRWYLRLEPNALIHGDVQYFISFPIIFRQGLLADENRESWLLLVELIVRNWNATPSDWRSHFVETFFGYRSLQVNNQSTTHESAPSTGVEAEKGHPDTRTQGSAAQSDGLGWMEDVWMTVSRPCVAPIKQRWIDYSGIMHAAYPQSTEPDERTSLPESSAHAAPIGVSDAVPDEARAEAPQAAVPKSAETRMEDSTQGLLEVLATLLEAENTSLPRTLCDRLRNSCLLKDERLSHDADSLRRIKTVLDCNQEG